MEISGYELVGQTDLGGHGDCMHVNVQDGYAYVGHMGGDRVGTSIVDVRDPAAPRVVAQIETPAGTHSHKVQVVGDVMLVNHEKNPAEPGAGSWSAGMAIYDVSDPADPQQVGFFDTPGKGVHRMTWFGGRHAWVSGSADGYTDQFLRIVDVADPSRPVEVGRWWEPGMHTAGGETPTWPEGRRSAIHHALFEGDTAYATWWDSGLYILDVSDVTAPRMLGHLALPHDESGSTHTALPLAGRGIVLLVDETVKNGPEHLRSVRIVDVSDPSAPRVIGKMPTPPMRLADPNGRFGPHNFHEMRPGSYSSSDIVHLTYFSGGLRVYDVSDIAEPREIAFFVPDAPPGRTSAQLNDLYVAADGTVYVTDRFAGGLYILRQTF